MGNLLDEIAVNMNFIYLSDLRDLECSRKNVLRALRKIPTGAYSLDQWTEAVQYITGDKKKVPTTEQQARDYIIQSVN